MAKNFIVSIFTKDRVGIIADVTNAVLALDGDLGDLNQAVLNGYFTMILIAEFSVDIENSEFEKKIEENFMEESHETSVVVKSLPDSYVANKHIRVSEDDTYVMTVTSDNRKGLVAEVSEFCKNNQINIVFLSTKLSEGEYVMIFLIDLVSIEFLDVLREKIKEFASERQLQIVLQHNDIFRATNEIAYYK